VTEILRQLPLGGSDLEAVAKAVDFEGSEELLRILQRERVFRSFGSEST
jgi:hypothetical protein